MRTRSMTIVAAIIRMIFRSGPPPKKPLTSTVQNVWFAWLMKSNIGREKMWSPRLGTREVRTVVSLLMRAFVTFSLHSISVESFTILRLSTSQDWTRKRFQLQSQRNGFFLKVISFNFGLKIIISGSSSKSLPQRWSVWRLGSCSTTRLSSS